MTVYHLQPPMAGTEVEHLIGSLERQRATFRWKVDGLDRAGLRTRIGASALTLGGLLNHLAHGEDGLLTLRLRGTSIGPPWTALPAYDGSKEWQFGAGADVEPAVLYRRYDDAVVRHRERLAAALADGGLDQPSALSWGGETATLRRLLCDILEEYGRHTGHADLLREAVDGRVGEDPPDGWRPDDRSVRDEPG